MKQFPNTSKKLYPNYPYLVGGVIVLIFLIWLGVNFFQYRQQSQQLSVWMAELEDVIDPSVGYEMAEKARQLAVQLGKREETGKAYYYMAIYDHEQNRFSNFFSKRASLLAEESLNIFKASGNAYGMAQASLFIQGLEFIDQDRQKFQQFPMDSLLGKMSPDDQIRTRARWIKNKATLLAKQHRANNDSLLKSNHLLLQAAHFFQQVGDSKQEAICYRNMGIQLQDVVFSCWLDDLYEEGVERAREGIELLNKSLDLFQKRNDLVGASNVLHKLGNLYTEYFLVSNHAQHLDTALSYFQTNLKGPYPFHPEIVMEGIATVYTRKYEELGKHEEDKDSALFYFQASADASIQTTNLDQLTNTLEQWEHACLAIFDLPTEQARQKREEALRRLSIQATSINAHTYEDLNQFDLEIERQQAGRYQRNILLAGGALLSSVLFMFIIIYQRSRLEKLTQQLEFSLKLAQTKMNPHFIGNTLNSIDSLINNDEREDGKEMASEYLVKFSRLADSILRNSDKTRISLRQEIETLENYVELERLRLNERFEYTLDISPALATYSVHIPPMLIQPIVENAIWHGLQHKIYGYKEQGELSIQFYPDEKSSQFIRCVVTDNGIGRAKARELQGKKQTPEEEEERSHATEILGQRLQHLGFMETGTIEIEDLYDSSGKAVGTRVDLKIPIFQS